MSVRKDQNHLIAELLRAGWTKTQGSKSIKLFHPEGNGRFVTAAISPKGPKHMDEMRSSVKRLNRKIEEEKQARICAHNAGTLPLTPPVKPEPSRDAHERWKGPNAKPTPTPEPFNAPFKAYLGDTEVTHLLEAVNEPTPEEKDMNLHHNTNQPAKQSTKTDTDVAFELLSGQVTALTELTRSLISGVAAVNKRLDVLCEPIELKREEAAFRNASEYVRKELGEVAVNVPRIVECDSEEDTARTSRAIHDMGKAQNKEFRTQRAAGFSLAVVRVK